MSSEVASPESQRLREKIELVLPGVLAASRELSTDPRLPDLYPEYLFTVHCVIRASVPLMEAARTRAEGLGAGDPVAVQLAAYLGQHIPEELHHDEWLLDDLAVLGREAEATLARPPSATVAGLVGAQYYWIFHFHPVALLGYIAVLEGYPPSPDQVEELIERTGFGRDAFRTLISHAELDPGHRDELDELLDGLTLTPEQSSVMGLSAMYSGLMLARTLEEVMG